MTWRFRGNNNWACLLLANKESWQTISVSRTARFGAYPGFSVGRYDHVIERNLDLMLGAWLSSLTPNSSFPVPRTNSVIAATTWDVRDGVRSTPNRKKDKKMLRSSVVEGWI